METFTVRCEKNKAHTFELKKYGLKLEKCNRKKKRHVSKLVCDLRFAVNLTYTPCSTEIIIDTLLFFALKKYDFKIINNIGKDDLQN